MPKDKNMPPGAPDTPEHELPGKSVESGDYSSKGKQRFKEGFSAAYKTVKNMIGFLARSFKAQGDNGEVVTDLHRAFKHLNFKKLGLAATVVLVLLYLLSGIFVVNPGEVAVLKVFGKVVNERVGEGLRYRFPWPIATADVVNVATIRREGIGIMLPEHKSIHSSPNIIQFLTGDSNIIDIQAVIQYRIKDAPAYLYNVDYSPYLLINEIVRSAITEIGGGMQVDEILTIGKERLQRLIRAKTQKTLDGYGSGIQLVGINLNKVYPPEEVAESFRDVSNAKQDREKTINDAWGYRNTVLPQARADADRLTQESEAYKIDVTNRASGEAARFDKILVEYNKNKKIYSVDVTRYRLYLESMEKVMARVKKFMVNPAKGGKVNLRFLEGEVNR